MSQVVIGRVERGVCPSKELASLLRTGQVRSPILIPTDHCGVAANTAPLLYHVTNLYYVRFPHNRSAYRLRTSREIGYLNRLSFS